MEPTSRELTEVFIGSNFPAPSLVSRAISIGINWREGENAQNAEMIKHACYLSARAWCHPTLSITQKYKGDK